MGADYYIADSENGDQVDDPSEDSLFMRLRNLDHDGNSFVTITPADLGAPWYASVSVLEEGGYAVEYSDPRHGEHALSVNTDLGEIARDLTIWLARRNTF